MKGLQIRIRNMERADVPYVCDIQMQCFGKRTPADFDKCIADKKYWYGVVLWNTSIIGYFGCLIVGDVCEILDIAVDELYRKRYVGTNTTALVIFTAKKRGCKKVMLEVDEHNRFAQELYNKFGFEKISRRKNYYPNGHDAIIMQLILPDSI